MACCGRGTLLPRHRVAMDTAVWVRDYIDHLEDAAYVRELFASQDVTGVSRVLVAMLRSGDAHETQAALLFVRDVVNYGMVPRFTEHLPRSGILDALRANPSAPDYAIRQGSVYTIGKIGPRANAPLRCWPRHFPGTGVPLSSPR